jgi:micrococcal nuclease
MPRKPSEFAHHPARFSGLKEGEYRAVCKHVVDGDTFDFFIDLGWYHYAYETIRLRGIDTPEIRGPERPEGLAVKMWVVDRLLFKPCVLVPIPDVQTFGRFVADVWVLDWDETGESYSLAEEIRKELGL